MDANLLLLLTVGNMDPDQIPKFKRTQHFTSEDFDALIDIIAKAGTIVTTPHILTEVSNLANGLREDLKPDFASAFREVVHTLDERWTEARELSAHEFFRFGIADVAAFTASQAAILLTQDGRFASQVNASGGYALSLEIAVELRRQEL